MKIEELINKAMMGDTIRIRFPRDFKINRIGAKTMTKNKALSKLAKVDEIHQLKYGSIRPANEVIIDKLVALGVLKVEEEKTLKEDVSECRLLYSDIDAFIEGLAKRGYEIVKKGSTNA